MNIINRLWKEEAGQGVTEYGLIIALLAVALMGTLFTFKDKISSFFDNITLFELSSGS